ncbi:hypothetical protein GQR58_014772 [Nymphon striatum]|nr:hypothetical protein GQR58_014772 [Nymphon striatum]
MQSGSPFIVGKGAKSVHGKRDGERQRRVWGDDVKEWSRSASFGQAKRTAEKREKDEDEQLIDTLVNEKEMPVLVLLMMDSLKEILPTMKQAINNKQIEEHVSWLILTCELRLIYFDVDFKPTPNTRILIAKLQVYNLGLWKSQSNLSTRVKFDYCCFNLTGLGLRIVYLEEEVIIDMKDSAVGTTAILPYNKSVLHDQQNSQTEVKTTRLSSNGCAVYVKTFNLNYEAFSRIGWVLRLIPLAELHKVYSLPANSYANSFASDNKTSLVEELHRKLHVELLDLETIYAVKCLDFELSRRADIALAELAITKNRSHMVDFSPRMSINAARCPYTFLTAIYAGKPQEEVGEYYFPGTAPEMLQQVRHTGQTASIRKCNEGEKIELNDEIEEELENRCSIIFVAPPLLLFLRSDCKETADPESKDEVFLELGRKLSRNLKEHPYTDYSKIADRLNNFRTVFLAASNNFRNFDNLKDVTMIQPSDGTDVNVFENKPVTIVEKDVLYLGLPGYPNMLDVIDSGIMSRIKSKKEYSTHLIHRQEIQKPFEPIEISQIFTTICMKKMAADLAYNPTIMGRDIADNIYKRLDAWAY